MPRKPAHEESEQRNENSKTDLLNFKRTEEALRQCTKRFQSVTNSIKELLILLDPDFKIQMINTTLAEAYNVSLDECKGKYCYEFFYGRDRICGGCPAIQVLHEGKVTRGSLRYRPDGRIFDRTAYPYIEDNADVTGVIVIGCDITQQKQAEEALLEKERFLQNVFDGMYDGISVLDTELNIIRVNQFMEKLYGDNKVLIGKKCYEVYQQRKSICPWCPSVKAIKTGEPHSEIVPFPTRENPERWIDLTSFPMKDAENRVYAVIEHVKDITDRKRAEEALRESERKYSDLVQESPDAIISVDKTGNLLSFNPAAERISGFSAEQVMGKHFAKIGILAKQSMPKALKEFALVIKGIERPPFELTVMRKDKSYLFMEANPRLIKHNGGKAWVQATFRDITNRKRAEEALRESEKKYRNLLETTLQGYWMVNPELNNIEVNPSICKMLGYSPDEMLGKTPFDFVDDENRKIFFEQTSKISTIPQRSYEITLKTKDGQDLKTYINATTIRDKSGEVRGSFALITDITDIKQTEQKLKQRERELERKSNRLEEMNTALKILLKKRDEDKTELEEKVMTNVKELVLPYVSKLKNTALNDRQKTFADIIESNIKEIVSPFAQKLSHKYLNFTPTELKVAYLVKQGLRTKEIAKLLGSSPETITRHRKSMRKKLKLTDKKSNLRTHLLSLANGYIE